MFLDTGGVDRGHKGGGGELVKVVGRDGARTLYERSLGVGVLAAVPHEHGGGVGRVAEGHDGGDVALLFAGSVCCQKY